MGDKTLKNRKTLYIVLAIIAVGILCAVLYPKQNEQPAGQEADKMTSYVERFNQSNSTNPIDTASVQNYYHHGSEHNDQITFNRDGFEIVVSSTHGSRFKTVIKGERQKTNDEYKNTFSEFAKAYSPTLSEQTISEYWTRLMDDDIHSVTFDEFECSLSGLNGKIEMITIDGNIQ